MGVTKYIYAIQHNRTRRIYIGCSQNFFCRYKAHLARLRSGSHPSKLMQADFERFGEDYSLFKLEEVSDDQITRIDGKTICVSRAKEIEWMKKYRTTESGYNQQDKVAKNMINKEKVDKTIPFVDGLPEEPGEDEL